MIIESSLLCYPSDNVGFGGYKSLDTEMIHNRPQGEIKTTKKEKKESGELGQGDEMKTNKYFKKEKLQLRENLSLR